MKQKQSLWLAGLVIIFTLVVGAYFTTGLFQASIFGGKNYNLLYTSRDIGSVVCDDNNLDKILNCRWGFFGEGNSRNVKHTESLNSLDFYFDSSSKWFNTVGDTNAYLSTSEGDFVMRDGETLVLTSWMNVTYEASNIEFGTYKVKQSDGSYKDVTFLVGIVRNFAFDIDATKVIDHKLMSPPALEFNSKPSAILDVLQTDYTPKKLIFETNTITEIPSLFRGTFTRTSGVYNSSPNTKIEVYPRTDELGSSRLRAVSNIVFYVGNSRVATISSLNGFDYTFAVEPKIKDGSNVQNLTIPQTFGSARLSGVSDARTFQAVTPLIVDNADEIKAQTNVAGILTTEIIRPVSQADAIGSSTLNWWVVGVVTALVFAGLISYVMMRRYS